MAESLSLQYRSQLAMSKEEVGELNDAVFLRNFNHIEVQRRLFQNIRHTEGQIKCRRTFKVTAQEKVNQVDYT